MKHYFQTPNPDLATIQKKLVMWFKEHEFDVNAAEADGEYLIQARKTGTFRALTGTNQAFKVKLYPSDGPNEFVFENAIGAWTSNLAGVGISAMFTGGFTLLTGAAGVAWAKKTEREIVEYIETTLQFRRTKSVDEKGAVVGQPAPRVAAQVVAAAPPTPVPAAPAKPLSPYERAVRKGQAELRKMQDAHEAGILSDEELAAKKKEVQAKAAEWEEQFAVEDRAAKLRAARDNGILEQAEYDAKVAALEQVVRQDVQAERERRQKDAQLAKLKGALEAGVLSREEYEAKVAALG
ncbi:MAG: SHOCT domain-containing protein [Gemmataceae bacterium]|nr:SHOCT domain-containing protein [Gemmataceae bacterium]